MGWRTIVISGRAKLDLKMNHLVVRKEDIVKVHINEINTLIIESTTVSLTVALLAALSKAKVKVIFCDEKHNPFGELTNYYSRHNSSLRVKNQTNWKSDIKIDIWTEIVRSKILKQAQILQNFKKNEAEMLFGYLSELKRGDCSNREGHAAKVYFNALFGLSFTREKDSPINAALNYGYSILLSSFNQEVSNFGYITQLGIFHDNQFNQYNLSSDLMEPFRPYVDYIVVNLSPSKFEKDEKVKLLELLEKNIWIDDKLCNLKNGISIYCKSIFDALENENVNMIKKFSYEL